MNVTLLRVLVFCMMIFSVMHCEPASARPHYPSLPTSSRTWVDKRVDALGAQALSTLAPQALVDADRASVANSLANVRRPLFFLWAFAQIFGLFLSWRSGFAARMRDMLARRIRNIHLLRALFTCVFIALVSLIAFPFVFISFHLARIVGVSYESLANFSRDSLVATGVEMAVGALIVTLVLALVDRARLWYLYAIGIFVAFGLIGLVATPVVIEPLFHTITPVSTTSALGARLYDIEKKAGVGYIPIFLTNLSRVSEVGNANVEGIGPTRRVLVGDTLLRTATPDEVSFVMAHELGHVVNDDALHITLLADLLTILAIAAAILAAERMPVRGDDDPLSRLTLIAALAGVFSLTFFPIGNAYSRMVEARADRFGVSVTHDGVAGARMFVRFADEGFAPVCPPLAVRLYFYDHPPLGSRITAATGRPDACR